METDAAVDRLDRIIAILRIAHADKIDALRATVRTHPVDAAIFDATEDWAAGGDLRRAVAKKSGQSERNVTNRFAALIALGALERRGDARGDDVSLDRLALMAKTNPTIRAALRKKLGGVSPQALSQRRAKIQALVPMPVDIATYVIASREGIRLHRELDAATLEQVADFDARLHAREQANGQLADPPRRTRARRTGGTTPTTIKQLQIGNFTAPVRTLNPQHTTDATRMAEVYPLLYTFENSMREYIDGHLRAIYADKWHIAHSENGWKVFNALFPTDKWLHGRVEVIEASRNVLAHMNPLQKRDVDRIRINFEDWLDQIENTLPS